MTLKKISDLCEGRERPATEKVGDGIGEHRWVSEEGRVIQQFSKTAKLIFKRRHQNDSSPRNEQRSL